LRRVISIAAALLTVALAGPATAATAPTAADTAMRATARARGTDRPTAIAVGRAVLAQPFAAQVTRIRCEKLGPHRICGIVLSGVKFKRPLDRRAFIDEVSRVITTAFATAPLEEVDLWTTVPLDAGKGIVVSGDLAAPTSATVFAISVPRTALARLDDQLDSGRDVYWDSAFADSLAKGSPQ
jgi:hypothetical protein